MKAAIYLRVSTDEQAKQDLSIPMQREKLVAYCGIMGWTVYEIYVDEGYSGKNLERPGVKRMIKDAKGHKFDTVLVWKLDRMSRRQRDVMYLLEDVFLANKVNFASVTENLDSSTPAGRAMIGLLAVFAQLERETIVERVNESMVVAARQGRYLGGTPPYGYVHVPGKKNIEPDPLQAEIVRVIFGEYVHGKVGIAGIAKKLNKRKVPPISATMWSTQTVRTILSNASYTGKVKFKGKTYPGHHEPIIEESVFEEAQKLLEARYRPKPIADNGYLAGIIWCNECGARMRYKKVRQSSGTESRYYVCYTQEGSSPHMMVGDKCTVGYKHVITIDDKVVEKLKQISINDKLLDTVVAEMTESVDVTGQEKALAKAIKDRDGIAKRIERWSTAYEDGSIEIAEYNKRTKELRDRREYLESEIETLEMEIAINRERHASVFDIKEGLRNFATVWEFVPDEDKKPLIQNLVEWVKVDKNGDITMQFVM